MRFCSLLLPLTTLAVPAVAAPSEPIAFEALVRDAAAIALVKPAAKPRTSERVAITPPGKPADPRRYPPFEFVVHEYEIVKVLKGDARRLGKRLRVYPADFDKQLRAHRDQYLRGVSRPWSAAGYEPQRPPSGTSTEPIVVFLRREGSRWTFAAEGAVEASERAADVAAALAKP
jgi:hypothetical protein